MKKMIELTRLNNSSVVINSDLIQSIEATPDTVITLTNGIKYVVTEPVDRIIEKIISFKKKLYSTEIKKD